MKCPKCGGPADIVGYCVQNGIEVDDVRQEIVFICNNEKCATPSYGLGDVVSYMPFTFLENGAEVL